MHMAASAQASCAPSVCACANNNSMIMILDAGILASIFVIIRSILLALLGLLLGHGKVNSVQVLTYRTAAAAA